MEDSTAVGAATSASELAAQLAKLLGPTAEIQTGGVGFRDAGKVVRRGGPPKMDKVVDTKAIVGRIRISYPALRAARVDGGLRQLLMAELIAQTHSKGGSLVVPQGLRVQPVAPEQYRKYKEALSGLTEANAH